MKKICSSWYYFIFIILLLIPYCIFEMFIGNWIFIIPIFLQIPYISWFLDQLMIRRKGEKT